MGATGQHQPLNGRKRTPEASGWRDWRVERRGLVQRETLISLRFIFHVPVGGHCVLAMMVTQIQRMEGKPIYFILKSQMNMKHIPV